MMLDGPQAWKSKTNGFVHARVSERELNTAAKTGLPGMVKPATYRLFAEFCLDVYDALCRRGVRDYTLEQLQADVRRDSFGGVLMAIVAAMVVQRTERGDLMFLTSTTRHAQHALDVDAPALLLAAG